MSKWENTGQEHGRVRTQIIAASHSREPAARLPVYRPWSVMPQPAVDFILDIKIN